MRFRRSSPSSRRIAAAAMVVAAWLITSAAPVSAYVRYRSKTGCAYSWHTRKLALTGFPQGMTDLDESQIANAVIESANAWSQVNPALATCTDLRISVTMMTPSDTPPAAVYDHQNNVMFRHGTWCPDPRDANCRDPHALAITSVFARTSGEIVDADIEVNTMIFTWGDLVTEPAVGGRQDLQNALTHEMGHFIGFDHTCDTSSRPPKPVDGSGDAADGGADVSQVRPRDQNGDLVPYCTDVDLPLSVRMTTMFASSDPGDVSKRTLEDDDLQAVCHSYPLGLPDPESCSGSSHEAGGCAVAPEHGGTLTPWQMWSAAALGLLAVLLSLSPLRRARARVRSRRQRR